MRTKHCFAVHAMVLILLLAGTLTTAQVKVGNSANPIHPAAALEVDGQEGGVLIPRMTPAQRDAIKSPAEGLLIFNTSAETLDCWDGSAWISLSASFVTAVTGTTANTGGIAINTTGDVAAPSAMLDIQSTEKGLLLPRTNQLSISEPVDGLLIYSTVSKSPMFYAGSNWITPCQEVISTSSAVGTAGGEGVLIGESAGTPDASAMLEVRSTEKGLLLPRLTDAQRDELEPAIGLMIYNTTGRTVQYYTSTGWFQTSLAASQPSAITASIASPWQYDIVTYSVVNEPGVTYTWTVPADWSITGGQGASQITVTVGVTDGTVEVVPTGSCGDGPAQVLPVEVKKGFVTTWNTENTLSGGSASNQVEIAMFGPGYDCKVHWGDGSAQNYTYNGSDALHFLTYTYAVPGIYTITIVGGFPRIIMTSGEVEKLLTIDQWGDIAWTSMANAFKGCYILTGTYADSPDLTSVSSMFSMFRDCGSFDSPVNNWVVSSVTDMKYLFSGCSSFNQPLNSWDVSSVTDMSYMFEQAEIFNQPLGNWDVSSVTDMSYMFDYADSFNQSLANWDVSSVTNMRSMFGSCSSFNQPLNSWDVSSVTDMGYMFKWAYSFDQPLANWDVSSVTTMIEMFSDTEFNQPIDSWDVSSVTDMNKMFEYAIYFDQPLANWDVSSVTNMGYMFSGAESFNQPLNSWDVSSVTNMAGMFQRADSFDQPLANWDVSSVTVMGAMFNNAQSFDQPLANWDVSSVTNMSAMFQQADSFDQPLENWDVSSVTSMSSMFANADLFNQPLDSWDVSSVTNMSSMFSRSEFDQDISQWNTSNVTNMIYMFRYAASFDQDLSGWCVSKIPSKPTGFDTGATSWTSPRPVWGTCP